MPPDLRDSDVPEEWLRRARSNLALARAGRPAPEALYEDLCYDAHQAAEKAIKAVLIGRRSRVPKTHSIGDLLALVSNSGVDVPLEIGKASALTDYAVHARYPGLAEDVTEEEYRRAVELAEQVVRWAEGVLR
jgi:HEPN domain-containing protein